MAYIFLYIIKSFSFYFVYQLYKSFCYIFDQKKKTIKLFWDINFLKNCEKKVKLLKKMGFFKVFREEKPAVKYKNKRKKEIQRKKSYFKSIYFEKCLKTKEKKLSYLKI